ncbi:MAG: hypothetical protein ACC628_27475, partial [Pirellulaceae bacterium]
CRARLYDSLLIRLFDFHGAPCQLVWQESKFGKLRDAKPRSLPLFAPLAALGGERGKEGPLG